jgi:subtilisin-like proprotein convertase family protein
MTDHSGVTVTTYPGGASAVTDASGSYTIDGLYDATYEVVGVKEGWSTCVIEDVVVAGGGMTYGIDMMLSPVVVYKHCESPGMSIPDYTPAGVYSTLTFPEGVAITDVEVYVDITHTYIGDLIVELTSPEGTTVRLHDRSGGSAANLVGWYDSELSVDGPGALSDYVTESSSGEWTLWVSDNASYDTGVLNQWCVEVTGAGQTGVDGEGEVPSVEVLRGAVPNPFNPVTTLSYGVPRDSEVHLAVYNVAGRLVRTLVDGSVAAGYHSVVWDGRDDHGVPSSSGVYFCRMESEGFTGTTKMVLLK